MKRIIIMLLIPLLLISCSQKESTYKVVFNIYYPTGKVTKSTTFKAVKGACYLDSNRGTNTIQCTDDYIPLLHKFCWRYSTTCPLEIVSFTKQ